MGFSAEWCLSVFVGTMNTVLVATEITLFNGLQEAPASLMFLLLFLLHFLLHFLLPFLFLVFLALFFFC